MFMIYDSLCFMLMFKNMIEIKKKKLVYGVFLIFESIEMILYVTICFICLYMFMVSSMNSVLISYFLENVYLMYVFVYT